MLRILDHAWHQAHSYRLHALPAHFDYFPVGTRYWDPEIRPIPPNFGGMVADPDLASYDVVLSHLDNWCDRSELRATPFRILNLMAMGAPILGDRLYGPRPRRAQRLMLHACRIALPPADDFPARVYSAPVPDDLISELPQPLQASLPPALDAGPNLPC